MTKNETPRGDGANLGELRSAIDAVDTDLLALLEKRYGFSDTVTVSKHSKGAFRPGREGYLIRRLVSETSLDPLLVESVWRQIIAFSLDRQKKLGIALAGGEAVERTARFRFGAVAAYARHDTPGQVMDAIAKGEADLGILAHWSNDDWWQELAGRRDRGDSVYIVSTAPMQPAPGLEPVAVLAPELPDPSGKDTTLLHGAVGVDEKDGYDSSPPNLLGIVQQPLS